MQHRRVTHGLHERLDPVYKRHQRHRRCNIGFQTGHLKCKGRDTVRRTFKGRMREVIVTVYCFVQTDLYFRTHGTFGINSPTIGFEITFQTDVLYLYSVDMHLGIISFGIHIVGRLQVSIDTHLVRTNMQSVTGDQ